MKALLPIAAVALLAACGAQTPAPPPAETEQAGPAAIDHADMDHSGAGHDHSEPAEGTAMDVSWTDGVHMLTVSGPSIIAPPAGRDVAAGFFALTSEAGALTLVSASSPSAATIEIHDHLRNADTGAMAMVKIDSVAVGAGETVELRSGGKHLMLFGVTDLVPGETVALTLTFAEGPVVTLDVPVEAF